MRYVVLGLCLAVAALSSAWGVFAAALGAASNSRRRRRPLVRVEGIAFPRSNTFDCYFLADVVAFRDESGHLMLDGKKSGASRLGGALSKIVVAELRQRSW